MTGWLLWQRLCQPLYRNPKADVLGDEVWTPMWCVWRQWIKSPSQHQPKLCVSSGLRLPALALALTPQPPPLLRCAGAFLPSAGICLNPSVAAGLMAVSSVAVVSNSLLLRASHGAADSQGAPAGSQAQQPSGASM